MENITLQVDGMNCGHCEKAVANALEDLGVQRIIASAEAGTVVLDFDPTIVSLERIKSEINDIGYVCA